MHWAPQLPSSCPAIATRSPSYSSLRALATLLSTAAPPSAPGRPCLPIGLRGPSIGVSALAIAVVRLSPRAECAPRLRWPLYPEMAVPRRAKSDNCCLRAAHTRAAPPEMKRLFLKHRGTRVHPIREWDRQPSKVVEVVPLARRPDHCLRNCSGQATLVAGYFVMVCACSTILSSGSSGSSSAPLHCSRNLRCVRCPVFALLLMIQNNIAVCLSGLRLPAYVTARLYLSWQPFAAAASYTPGWAAR